MIPASIWMGSTMKAAVSFPWVWRASSRSGMLLNLMILCVDGQIGPLLLRIGSKLFLEKGSDDKEIEPNYFQ